MSNAHLNLLVISSSETERLADFYRLLGCEFEKHRHGNGPEHYVFDSGAFVFEIYPLEMSQATPANVRIGFSVDSIDSVIESVKRSDFGLALVSPPRDSEWGRRAVIDDPDGNRIELIEPLS